MVCFNSLNIISEILFLRHFNQFLANVLFLYNLKTSRIQSHIIVLITIFRSWDLDLIRVIENNINLLVTLILTLLMLEYHSTMYWVYFYSSIRSDHSNRKQYKLFSSIDLDIADVGVPQHRILGSHLCLIYINKLYRAKKDCKIQFLW